MNFAGNNEDGLGGVEQRGTTANTAGAEWWKKLKRSRLVAVQKMMTNRRQSLAALASVSQQSTSNPATSDTAAATAAVKLRRSRFFTTSTASRSSFEMEDVGELMDLASFNRH